MTAKEIREQNARLESQKESAIKGLKGLGTVECGIFLRIEVGTMGIDLYARDSEGHWNGFFLADSEAQKLRDELDLLFPKEKK